MRAMKTNNTFSVSLLLCLAISMLFGCNSLDQPDNSAEIANVKSESGEIVTSPEVELKEGTIARSGISYNADLVTAFEFIERRGEKPDPGDKEQLRKEHVMILEIEDHTTKESTLHSERLRMSDEALASYMMSGIVEDVMVIQGEDSLFAHSAHFDKDIGGTSGARKLRAFLFFNNIDGKKKIETHYFDRLFGAGHIKL